MRLIVTDAAGQTATVEHNVTVSAPLISAPVDIAPPTISGTTTEGDQLTATSGTWSNVPLAYSYQWQDCNGTGGGCSNITGATASTYTLTKGDVDNTVRIVVTATNLGGSSTESSTATATVSALPVSEPEPEPEPISPPTNIAMPAISGTATEGQQLSTTNGTWSGDPTSYAYQWRHCNSSGHSCSNISGATSSGYTLASSDVGHAMRVMVTATNEGGSNSMSSPTTATVTAPTPAAPTNTAAPAISGTTTEGHTLSATAGTWTGSPTSVTYQWQDCNGSGASCVNITGASSSSYTLTEGDVGDTVRVVATASNAGGSASASSAASAIVTASESTPPPAPANTALPAISGTATEGSALSTSKGTWSGSPTSYAYQWQDCNASGASCTDIGGAASSSYVLGAGDVGDTVRVVVSASNAGGSASATSAHTSMILTSGAQQTDCINAPSACGYPDATNTGVPAGTALASKNEEITVTKAGTMIKDIALNGSIAVDANNTTIEDSDIVVNGTQSGCNSPCGGHGIWIKEGVKGTVIQDVTCHGGAPTGANVTEFCIQNNDSSTEVKRVHFYNCTTCMIGPGTWSDNFVDQTGAEIPQEHYEDIYYGGGDGPLVVNHNTMLNPREQTAVVFASVDFGDQTSLTITNNLMAGGGYMIYGGGSGNGGKITGPLTVTGNRFSRKYYPEGGYYGLLAYNNEALTTWTGNIWDDTLKPAEE